MWLFTSSGCLDVGEDLDDRDEGCLTVRAPTRAPLQALRARHPSLPDVSEAGDGELPFSLRGPRAAVEQSIAALLADIDYRRLTDALDGDEGRRRLPAYERVAAQMRRLARPPYADAPGRARLRPRLTDEVVDQRGLFDANEPGSEQGAGERWLAQMPSLSDDGGLCFYPSAGESLLWAVMRLDAANFVMVEKQSRLGLWSRIKRSFEQQGLAPQLVHASREGVVFDCRGKRTWLLFADNNRALARVREAGLRVSHFVGICDGCCEGGNLECVHERPFLRGLMPVAADGMRYITDHSEPLEDRHRNRHGRYGFQPHAYFRERLDWRDFPEASQYRRREPVVEKMAHPADHLPRRFELQGLLLWPGAPARGEPRTREPTAAELEVMRFGPEPVALMKLRAFRTMDGRGILAEYRVWAGDSSAAR